MKIFYFILSLLIIHSFSKTQFEDLEIQFDYSNIKLEDSQLEKFIKRELNIASKYIKQLLKFPINNNVQKELKKFNDSIIKCEDNSEYKFNKKEIMKNITLLIIPIFKVNAKTKHNNFPILNQCIIQGTKPLVIAINFEYITGNVMKKQIPINFENLNYQWIIFRFILSSLGFNKQNLIKRKIVNNIFNKDQSLLSKYSFYNSFQKFAYLTNYSITSFKKDKYINFWPSLPKFNDLMGPVLNKKNTIVSITEMTLDMMKELGYQVNQCELISYKNRCFRVNQKCLNDFEYEKYYIHYTLDTIKQRWICFYKTEEHYIKNQCSKDFGFLIKSDEINKNLLIDHLRQYDYQQLVLLKPSPNCPKPHPRTIFYMSVKPKEDPYQYKFLENTEEVVIKNPKYFVITNTFSTYYNVKFFAANYNGVFTNNTFGWNFNYLWKMNTNLDPSDKGLYQKKNKYQLIGEFPNESTFKDGLNNFYNKLKEKFPDDYNYIPETYLYPEQKKEIYNKFHNYKYDPKDVWLFKPAKESFARGVEIIDNYTEIEKSKYKHFLISRYIMNPMLIRNKKFDMRAYVLVTGMNPLKVYFYKDGYVKIPVKNFTLDYEYIKDGCIHITTSDTNLVCFGGKEYKYDTDIYDEPSNFWSYVFFERYCNRLGINYTYIMDQMKDIFIKTFISLNSDFIKKIKKKKYQDRNLYQLYGLDLLIDDNYKVYLLELNRNPSMRGGHAVADYIYENIIADILNIVGIVPFAHDETQEPMDKDIYYYDNITEEIVDDCLCEFTRPRGMFELIYPLKDNINKYKKFYENISPQTNLLWNKLLKSNGEYN